MNKISIIKYTFLLFVFFFMGNKLFSQNNTAVVKSENKYISQKNKLETSFLKVNTLMLANSDTIQYANQVFLPSVPKKDSISIAEFYRINGKKYAEKRDYKQALANYNYAETLLQNEHKQEELANLYNSIGIVYGKIYNYDKALYYLHKSITILIKEGDNKKISASLNNLGVIYRGLKDYYKSQTIFQQSLFFARKSGDQIAIASSLNNISLNYIQKMNYKEALRYQLDAIKIFEKFKNKKRLCSSYISLGAIYKRLNNKKGLEYFYKSSKLAAEVNDQYLLSLALQNIGSTYLSMNQYQLAYEYLSKSEAVANEIKDFGCIKSVNEVLAEYYKKKGDFENALKHHEIFKNFNDSIYNKESNERFLDLQIKYEVEEKDNENKILKQESIIQQLAIQKQIYLRNAFIAVSVMIAMLVLFILFRFYIKKKANKILSEKNRQISTQKNHLEDAYATKDKLFAIITHDLKNPFGTIISLAGYLEESFIEIDENQKRHAIKTIKKSADAAYDLLENLTKWLLSQNKDFPVNKSGFDINIAIQTILTFYRIESENKNIEIEFDFSSANYVYADEQMIKTIIRNLISNAIKFTPKNGKITVGIINLTDEIQIVIKDNGIGIKEKDKEKIFKVGSNFTTTGTLKEKGSGLGLILAKEFADRNKSKIWFESEVGKGSAFYFSVLKLNKNGYN